MKLPKFLRGSEEEQPEPVDILEAESMITETASPEGEGEEAAMEAEAGPAAAGEVDASAGQEKHPLEEHLPEVPAEAAPSLAAESPESIEGKPLEEIAAEKPVLEETGKPSPETEAGELPVSEELPVPEPAKPSWFSRFTRWLFNKETRLGQVMRQLALFAGVFGLGLLFAYFVWIMPQVRQNAALAAERQQTISELTAAENARASVEDELADTRTALGAAEDEVLVLEARLHLAKASHQAVKAQLAIVEKQGADALAALDIARAEVTALNGYLAGKDPDVATEIEARLTAAKSALVRDPELAVSDLETLLTLLAQQDKILAGK